MPAAQPLNLVENMDPSVPTQREWRPDIELDDWMEDPELWPTHGGWVNPQMGSTEQVQGTPDIPVPGAQEPSNGRFASGTSGPQPQPQDET